MVFTKKHQGEFEAIRTAVEAAIVTGANPASTAASSEGMDLVAQIAKLAEPRDAGALTVEESDAKKAQLLARM